MSAQFFFVIYILAMCPHISILYSCCQIVQMSLPVETGQNQTVPHHSRLVPLFLLSSFFVTCILAMCSVFEQLSNLFKSLLGQNQTAPHRPCSFRRCCFLSTSSSSDQPMSYSKTLNRFPYHRRSKSFYNYKLKMGCVWM